MKGIVKSMRKLKSKERSDKKQMRNIELNNKKQIKNTELENSKKQIQKTEQGTNTRVSAKIDRKIVTEIVKSQKGITLLVLVITIIILLILSGITIGAITGENGIIQNAENAKEQAEIDNEKEVLEKAVVQAMGNNKYGNIEEDELQEQLDKEIGEGKTDATDIGDEFEVIFNESNRYYTIDKSGTIAQVQDIIKDEHPGDITVGIDGKELDGSEEKPYEIWCIEDLVTFANMVNGEGIRLNNGETVEITTKTNFSGKYVNLKANLNFQSMLSYNNYENTQYGDLNQDGIIESIMIELTKKDEGCIGFKSIGISTTVCFQGIFDGKNNEIRNLYQNINNNRDLALFVNPLNATIQNLTITGTIINNSWYAAGICTANTGTEIINCKNYANITGYNAVGGIIDRITGNDMKIENCINYGNINITGMSYAYGGAGGIVGYINQSNNTVVEDCINEGEITGNINNRSGIVGCITCDATIKNCSNKGECISGIVTHVRAGKVNIENCYNLGECKDGIVSAFLGASWDSLLELNIQNSYNLGEVTNAGIIGLQGTICKSIILNIENCYNAGESDKAIIGNIKKDSRTEEFITNITNTYYDETKSATIGAISEGITSIEIQNNASLIERLNNNIGDNTTWKTWILGEEGYPVFE